MDGDDFFHKIWDSDYSNSSGASSSNSDTQTSVAVNNVEDQISSSSPARVNFVRLAEIKEDTPSSSSLRPTCQPDRGSTGLNGQIAESATSIVDGQHRICSICRGVLGNAYFSCTTCDGHIICPSCHGSFALDLWPSREHEFISSTSQVASSTNGSPLAASSLSSPPSAIDYNALLADKPSLGSIHHASGNCHPCHYAHSRVGCHFGRLCGLCHYTHKRKVKRASKNTDAPGKQETRP
mmetsp:Transcript_124479/g.195030  ORF Transcript_124479/g.195030 Transcript_124479/m.195030 type:complete len:238 (-) Transcript_124479:102-815(-)